MHIKEYRVPLPLSVEEYRIAQLYMIAKKSRTESRGNDNGVEIIKNEPYTDEKTGSTGQYTIKKYYMSSLLPDWLRRWLTYSVFSMKEEAWNAFPYTKTIYTCPLLNNKFYMNVETFYFNEPGLKENVFELDDSEIKKNIVDLIDIVKDQVPPKEYIEEEDPTKYVSQKTHRGPLNENWLKEYIEEYKRSCERGIKPEHNMMCAYKLFKTKVNFWGIGPQVIKFTHDFTRKLMVRAHKQAWCWQDEWYGLTMEDIREIEKETQRQLADQMNQNRRSSRGSIFNNDRRKSSINNTDINVLKKRIEQIAKESDSEDEFFDAIDAKDDSLHKWSSLEYANRFAENLSTDGLEGTTSRLSISKTPNSLSKESLTNSDRRLSGKRCTYSILIFVLHGGHVLDSGNEDTNNKYNDFSQFKSTFEQTLRASYSSLTGKLAYRLISCPSICKSSLQFLSKLSASYQSNGKFDYDTLSIDCLPLFAINLSDYQIQIEKTIASINQSYAEFISSSEGKHFNGRISFICDFLGGLLAYDSLCNTSFKSTNDLPCNSSAEPNENANQDNETNSRYDFQLDDLFLYGCPLSLVLAYRKLTSNAPIQKPHCSQVYNLFYPIDHHVMRIEPLIENKFSEISPISVPKYNKQNLLQQIVSIGTHLKFNQKILAESDEEEDQLVENSALNLNEENNVESNTQRILERWWGNNRIDYEFYCPAGINNLPSSTLSILFHSSFWESSDIAAFVLDKLMYEVDPDHYCRIQKSKEKLIDKPIEKWIKKSTSLKITKISSNHRANDIIAKEGQEQTLTARFMYGPLDLVALIGEKVDIYIMKDMTKDDWTFLGTEYTDKTGRVYHTIKERLGCGIYPVKMIVRGDHSSIDFFLSVLPPQTECIVFSIDGSFAASISVSGKDPKVRPCSVDIVRWWQELGYLIIYITGRPGMQQHKVLAWLSEHNFPFGLVYFTGGVTRDPLKRKALYLERLQQEVELSIHAAYGSSKDIWIYQALGLNRDNIFIVGKVSKKQQHLANIITDGYAIHLEELKLPGFCRRANNKIELPKKDSLGYCDFTSFCGLRRRNKATRTKSYPHSTLNKPRLSTSKFEDANQLTISSTMNSYRSINQSPASSNSNLFANNFNNRTFSNKSK